MLKPGLTATMVLPQFPGRTFKVAFDTTANSFNPTSRTVVTELIVDNADHSIWPGTYTDVHFVMPANPHILIVPEQSLLFRAQGMQVALVRPDDTVHLQDVKLGLNLGQSVQVLEGLEPERPPHQRPVGGTARGREGGGRAGREGNGAATQVPAAAEGVEEPELVAAGQGRGRARRHRRVMHGRFLRACAAPALRRLGLRRAALLSGLALLSGCDLAPLYAPPHLILPAQYQGSAPFEVARPQDQLARGPWWRLFGDPVLDRLEAQLVVDNPTLRAGRGDLYPVTRYCRRGTVRPVSAALQRRQPDAEQAVRASPVPRCQRPERGDLEPDRGGCHLGAGFLGPDPQPDQIRQGAGAGDRGRGRERAAQPGGGARLRLHGDARLRCRTRGLHPDDPLLTRRRFRSRRCAWPARSHPASTCRARRASSPPPRAADTDVLANRVLLQHAVSVLAGLNPSAFMLPMEVGGGQDDAGGHDDAGGAGGGAVRAVAAAPRHRPGGARDGGRPTWRSAWRGRRSTRTSI